MSCARPRLQKFKRFGNGKGAYMYVVAWAESAEYFERRVTAIAKAQLDCIVREMERVELLESTLQREGCPTSFSRCEALRKDSQMT